jgi:regulator of protease activity HflC (stomatin/prohibitin superfamily)
MGIQPVTALSMSRDRRNLNTVQRTLRAMMWLVIFVMLVVGALILSFLLGLTRSTPLSIVVLAVGGFLSLILPGMIARCLYVTPEFQRIVVLRLGKFSGVRGPGMFWVIPYPPFYQSVAAELDIRVQTRAITAAQTLTRDNVPVGCEAVIFWRVEDPRKAALEVADYGEAVFQAANSALKDTVGSMELTDLLSEREKVAHQLKDIIDTAAAKFGVDVSSVEITDIHVPTDLIQELSVIAQSRRSAQAKIAEADVEVEVAELLQQALRMSPWSAWWHRRRPGPLRGADQGKRLARPRPIRRPGAASHPWGDGHARSVVAAIPAEWPLKWRPESGILKPDCEICSSSQVNGDRFLLPPCTVGDEPFCFLALSSGFY